MISRAIIRELAAGRGVPGPYGQHVWLDLTHLGQETIDARLPFVRELATTYAFVDPVREPIPIRPVVHYMMGGVDVDIDGATSIPGLYAAGECACVSLNGANRLGSNSLTECLVFGARAGEKSVAYARGAGAPDEARAAGQAEAEAGRLDALRGARRGDERMTAIRSEMNRALESGCGVYREQASMALTCKELAQLQQRMQKLALSDASRVFNTELTAALELQNLLDVGEAVANAALARKESRGAHSCSDFPARNDAEYLHHSLVTRAPDGRPTLGRKAVTLGIWEPEERKY
jgi:fumarate reductase flavoprotein subunit